MVENRSYLEEVGGRRRRDSTRTKQGSSAISRRVDFPAGLGSVKFWPGF